jgi:hypothetical protein
MDFFASTARYPAMISAWGTGKSMTAILKAMDLSIRYPGNLGLVVRQDFTDLRDSTIKDFEKYTGIPVPTNKDVKLSNGSQIMFRHGSELKKLQNINLGWFFIEQAEEFESDEQFQLLRGRLRREGVPHQGFVIANACGHNWLWRMWKQNPTEDFELTEATTFDNPHLPEEFVKDLARMKEQSPSHYRRFVLNSHEDVDTADKCIPYQLLIDAVGRKPTPFHQTIRVVACDPAEFGNDLTVIYGMEGGQIIEQEVYGKKEPMETAGRVYRMARNIGADVIGVDEIGIGAGVRSRLTELGANVIGINAASVSNIPEQYKNLKAELWMTACQMFKDQLVTMPDDERLLEDLAAPSYKINSKGQVEIEKKDDTKKRLGRSPDMGDAFVMGLWLCSTQEPAIRKQVSVPDEMEMANSYTVKSVF